MFLAAATGELGQKARAISFRSSEVYCRIAVDIILYDWRHISYIQA